MSDGHVQLKPHGSKTRNCLNINQFSYTANKKIPKRNKISKYICKPYLSREKSPIKDGTWAGMEGDGGDQSGFWRDIRLSLISFILCSTAFSVSCSCPTSSCHLPVSQQTSSPEQECHHQNERYSALGAR